VNVVGRRYRPDLYIAVMPGADKSRAYCLEMIAADLLAGASQEAGAESTLFLALARLMARFPWHKECNCWTL